MRSAGRDQGQGGSPGQRQDYPVQVSDNLRALAAELDGQRWIVMDGVNLSIDVWAVDAIECGRRG
jgi:hypothetical protein